MRGEKKVRIIEGNVLGSRSRVRENKRRERERERIVVQVVESRREVPNQQAQRDGMRSGCADGFGEKWSRFLRREAYGDYRVDTNFTQGTGFE